MKRIQSMYDLLISYLQVIANYAVRTSRILNLKAIRETERLLAQLMFANH